MPLSRNIHLLIIEWLEGNLSNLSKVCLEILIKYIVENKEYKSKCSDRESKINSKEANRKLSL
jgi:hypothetical protein